jgi:rhamnosyltransferase
MLRVAGVTVLHNPDKEVISNIESYLNQVECLYIIDNSEEIKPFINIMKTFPQVKFLLNKGNIGIAAALNKAADQAIVDGFDLLLTMDQDSEISADLVRKMIVEFEKDKKIGILSPFVIHIKNPIKPLFKGLERIIVAMTSGCIIKLSAYKEIGKFLEKLFIDYVDNEFCLRMQLNGYKVLQLNSVFVYHKLGDMESRYFLFWKVYPTNHSALRWYYRTRNRLYVYKNYKNQFPNYVKYDKKVFLNFCFKILLYEKEKLKKIKMTILGYRDYKKDKFGKFEVSN